MNLFEYIEKSPTIYHAVDNAAALLKAAGAVKLCEGEDWALVRGQMYYVVRNDAALIAFCIPEAPAAYRVFAAHGDSPCYKVKENPEMVVDGKYVRLNVEGYGGMLNAPWFDRPLSVAGRVAVETEEGITTKLVNIDRDLLTIPNVAIHMNREVNKGYAYNNQVDMLPLYGGIESKGMFMKQIAENAGLTEEEILAHDLFVYTRDKGTYIGADQEFIMAPRLDDLMNAYAGLQGFLAAEKSENICIYVLFDNEEVGSTTRQGAASTFLKDTITGIEEAMKASHAETMKRISGGFMLSADNGHALHPNHPEKEDPVNHPVLNGGVLLKYSANQRYTTDAVSAAMFKVLCRKANVPFQVFVNRSDVPGGGTLGNISTTQVPFATADIGLAQLAMHSSMETAGAKDLQAMITLASALYA